MNFRPRKSQDIEVNVTPLIDVVFLLLIFFMITTSFKHESQVRINPPDSPEEPSGMKVEQTEIWVDKDGNYFVNQVRVAVDKKKAGSPVTEIALQLRAARKKESRQAKPLLICADADSAHEYVIKAMSAATKVGYSTVALCTKKPADN